MVATPAMAATFTGQGSCIGNFITRNGSNPAQQNGAFLVKFDGNGKVARFILNTGYYEALDPVTKAALGKDMPSPSMRTNAADAEEMLVTVFLYEFHFKLGTNTVRVIMPRSQASGQIGCGKNDEDAAVSYGSLPK